MSPIYLFASSPFEGLPVNVHFFWETFKEKREVYFFEPIGLRSPALMASDFRKVLSRFQPKEARDPHVIRTKVLPVGWGFDRLNGSLLEKQLPLGGDVPSWIFLPSFAPLLPKIKGPKLYMAVDFYAANPGVNAMQVSQWERECVDQADVLVATSFPLKEHLKGMARGKKVHLLPNGANVELFQSGVARRILQGPAVLMWGNVTKYKVDMDLVRAAAERLPHVNFYLVGPAPTGEKKGDVRMDLKNVFRFERRFWQRELADLAQDADLLWLCPPKNDSSRGSHPMKLMEYCATGRPVLVRPTEATEPYLEGVFAADDVDATVACIEDAVNKRNLPDTAKAVAMARSYGFDERKKRAWEILKELESISKNS